MSTGRRLAVLDEVLERGERPAGGALDLPRRRRREESAERSAPEPHLRLTREKGAIALTVNGPAVACPLDEWDADALMAEAALFVPIPANAPGSSARLRCKRLRYDGSSCHSTGRASELSGVGAANTRIVAVGNLAR